LDSRGTCGGVCFPAKSYLSDSQGKQALAAQVCQTDRYVATNRVDEHHRKATIVQQGLRQAGRLPSVRSCRGQPLCIAKTSHAERNYWVIHAALPCLRHVALGPDRVDPDCQSPCRDVPIRSFLHCGRRWIPRLRVRHTAPATAPRTGYKFRPRATSGTCRRSVNSKVATVPQAGEQSERN
jgi:hypothetical protein